MRKIRRIIAICVVVTAVILILTACTDDLDVKQVYRFALETMPVQKRIRQGETAEIRCTLVKEGNYAEARYHIRMFQPDGTGQLTMDDGTAFLPNDLYPLEKEVFRLYYTSHCTDQQTIDIYVEDNYGQVAQVSFSWQSESIEPEGSESE